MQKRLVTILCSATLVASIVAAGPALAVPAGQLQDLVGVKASSGEAELESRGFTFAGSKQGEGKSKTYWWNAQDGSCIRVSTEDGRYAEIVDTKKKMCGQKEGHAGAGKPVKVSDLKGMDSIRAIDAMSARGFTGVDSISSGDTLYGVYYNRSTGQCIQLTNANNKVESVDDIHTHPNCH